MNGNCHFVFGAALGTALAMNVGAISSVLGNVSPTPETTTLLVLGGLIGGIFPDIDNPNSYIGKLTSPVSGIFGKLGKATGKTGKNHRGILHDPAVYIAGLILCYLYFPPLVGFFVGCLSHMFLDMFNPMGVPFLFGAAHLHLGNIPSGSKSGVVFTWTNVTFVLVVAIIVKIGLFDKIIRV